MALTKVKAGNILLTTPGASSNDVTPATTQYVTTAIASKLPLAGGTLTGNLVVNAIVDADNFKINNGQGSDGQVMTSTGSGVAWETPVVTDTTVLENNIAILGFYRASDNSKAKYNLVDQIIDEYYDNSGIDTGELRVAVVALSQVLLLIHLLDQILLFPLVKVDQRV